MKQKFDYFYAQSESMRTKKLNNEVAFVIREVEFEANEDNKIDTFYAIGCNVWLGVQDGKEVEFCADAEGTVILPWKVDVDELVQRNFVHIPWKLNVIMVVDEKPSVTSDKRFWAKNTGNDDNGCQ